MDRREFIKGSVLAMFSGIAITVSACGTGGYNQGSPSGTQAQPGDKQGAISGNHGHVAIVTAAQINADQGVILNIQGSADHTHSVMLTAAQVQAIGQGAQVSVLSSNTDSHDHQVTFN